MPPGNGAPEPERRPDQPVPIISAEQYRFLRYAVELADLFAARDEGERDQMTGAAPRDPFPPRVSRLRAALWLFEKLSSSSEDAQDE